MLTIEEYLKQPIEIEKELQILFAGVKPKVIMDIGSCTGEDAIKYSNFFPGASVFAFEPLLSNVEIMKMHFRQFEKTDISIQNLALSDETGEASFYVSGGNPFESLPEDEFTSLIPKDWNKSSSLLKPGSESAKHLPWLKFKESVVVKTMRLDEFMTQSGIETIDFIHLDVQGAELKVLTGMGEKIKNINVLWLEVENVEMYDRQPLKNEINSFLKANNYQLVKDTSVGKIAGDCLYVNRQFLTFSKRLKLKIHFLKEKIQGK